MEVSMLGSWKMLNLYVWCRKLEESLRTLHADSDMRGSAV